MIPVSLTLAGIVLLMGAHRRWAWLIDPEEDAGGSQAFLKRMFGKRFLLYYTYLLGLLFTISGFYLLFSWVQTASVNP